MVCVYASIERRPAILVLEHMKRLVDACYPSSNEERLRLWHDIKPVKFGNRTQWTGVIPSDYILANYQIREDASYLAVLRVECYVTTYVTTAPDFGMHEPPPLETTGAVWRYAIAVLDSPVYNLTAKVPIHLLCDTDDMLLAKGGNLLQLVASLTAAPSGDQRFIRTTVYAYNLGAIIADRIGGGEPNIIGDMS